MQAAEAITTSIVESSLYRKFGQELFISQQCADQKLTL